MNPKTTDLLHSLVKRHIVPGVSYAMIHQGSMQSEVFGLQQIVPQRQQLRSGMLYDVASLTKVVCTTPMILKMVEEGKIFLEEPIQHLLPRFRGSRVTVRHLLTHTAAITGYIKDRDQLNGSELITAIYEQMYSGDNVGKHVHYTDIGFILLGQIIERFYQRSVQEVLAAEILIPLRLQESTFDPLPDFCVPTTFDHKRGLIKGVVHDPKAYVLGRHCASAGLFMSLNDLTKYCSWLLGEYGKTPILSEKMIEYLFADQTPTNTGGRSLGFDLRYDPQNRPCLYHTGFTGTFILIDKQNQDALVVLTNRVHPDQKNDEFLRDREHLIDVYLAEK